MATTKKKKGSKRKAPKKPDPASTEDVVANRLLSPPPPLEEAPVSKPPPSAQSRKTLTPPVRTSPISRKVAVRNVPDPTSKKVFRGRKSLNLQYGPNKISIVKGKDSKVPVGAIEHCRKLGLI
jgi:hypothetical protein